MKLSWFDVILILLGLFIAYQIIRAILGGSWEAEGIIIALLIFNIGATWKLSNNLLKLNFKFNGHINWHKSKD